MERVKKAWKRLPDKPRRILTLILGLLLILTSALIGWLPGPGGMVPFLLGIAVLATEFSWAERFRDWILVQIKRFGELYHKRPFATTAVLLAGIVVVWLCAYAFYTHIL